MGKTLLPAVRIERAILLFRGEKVLLDEDLATLYRVSVKRLNEAVKRNRQRFPRDFMFQLSRSETALLRSQFATSNAHGGRRYRPNVFTEHGVAMLSGVLRSERAVRVNIEIMRTFVRMRRILGAHAELAAKLDDLERRYDHQFKVVFDAIRELMAPPRRGGRRLIGFGTDPDAT